ncbi:lysis protein [Photorhabdus noenieputensis]|uniref:lysis protein n=1 Tax=Photorhabdus noenieputensis TaxID=1208607 RepID=UPI001BD65333|nr:lysis protein [Photorhabdus noenieputensis]MBS9438657.1 lysis protein [Photorhabdus noenieputensis]MCK3670934.1 lysis protein [Photorhabdus noenieputensis]
MKFNAHYYTILALIVISLTAYYYHSELQREQRVTKQQQSEIQQLTDTINYQNSHITMLNELDVKHTKELAHAKSEIDVLRDDVAAGRKRLRIAATCSQSEATATPGVGHAATVELTGEAGSTVLDIREGIINDQAKLRYLQDYVNAECGRRER